jgi:16S rRNA G966 N2-methylase RsmD
MKQVAAKLRAEDPKKNTQQRVAELLGVSRECVSKWFQRGRRRLHDGTSTGMHDESAFLADARFTIPARLRPEIIKRHLAGEPQVRIAADYKVDPSTISRIVRRHEADRLAAKAAAKTVAKASQLGELGVIAGDYRKAGDCLANASVELVFTDPPYRRSSLGEYADLGRFAARILKPGGSLITYLGEYALPEVLGLVLKSRELKFWWPLAVVHGGRTALIDRFGVAVRHKTLLWFVKGGQRARRAQVDSMVRSAPDKRFHQWGQGIDEAQYYIEKLTAPGALVVDPYAGGGTTCVAAAACGRRFLAFESDRRTALRARARLAEFLASRASRGSAS